MAITFTINHPISVQQFAEVLGASGLGERELVEDAVFMQGILDHADVLVSAWHGEQLVGVARSITDFHCACYLSELAIRKDYQNLGLGKKLQQLTQQQLGPRCKLILLATDGSNHYYEKMGFQKNPRCWVLEGG
ncbi:GNAT family N-acetyltransferase [Aestuariibacter halophilus]|uniref:GNAT family N-acetyltransferase n=1 Tax=Fluctibacter halophilus TaxID=226011 RepID=A0ABS8G8F3_9ALTE|nr:GNAT family N-acetyltransferase [Aestuariibacter halophilus]MCC2616825.1 GNAT family N-acetyltransferase [Aestuariibacter halophilus]